jgi:hypothetical protein
MPLEDVRQSSDTFAVNILDTARREQGKCAAWQQRDLKAELEKEFQLPFKKADIGPSFCIPAFVTAWLGGLEDEDIVGFFLLGKHLTEGSRVVFSSIRETERIPPAQSSISARGKRGVGER